MSGSEAWIYIDGHGKIIFHVENDGPTPNF
jgi:hypothetical protein